jgi:hypothetical protein
MEWFPFLLCIHKHSMRYCISEILGGSPRSIMKRKPWSACLTLTAKIWGVFYFAYISGHMYSTRCKTWRRGGGKYSQPFPPPSARSPLPLITQGWECKTCFSCRPLTGFASSQGRAPLIEIEVNKMSSLASSQHEYPSSTREIALKEKENTDF